MPFCAVHSVNFIGLQCPRCLFGAPSRAAQAPVVNQAASNNLPQGGALGIKCRRVGTAAFADINPASTLYVPRGTQLEFQLAAQNSVATVNFGTATWSGSSGATGVGGTCTVSFNAASASTADASAKLVTGSFSGQAVIVKCIVFDLTANVQPIDNFAGRSLADLGVDERVNLGFTTAPAGIAAAAVGGMRWRIVSPTVPGRKTAGSLHVSATNLGSAGSDGRAYFIAPYLTDNAHNPPTAPTKAVRLRLEIAQGPCTGAGIDQNFTVHMPIAHMTKQPGSDKHANGQASAGYLGEIHLFPKTVSFKTLRWREGGGRATATGVYATAGWNNLPHKATNKNPGTGEILNDMEVEGGDSTNGSHILQIDDVWSGEITYAPPPMASPTVVVGDFRWPIYWQYLPADMKGAKGGDAIWIRFQVAEHYAKTYQDGRTVIVKGHPGGGCAECTAQASKQIADPNERYP
jgi:hypothetical protein